LGLLGLRWCTKFSEKTNSPSGFTRLARFAKVRDVELRDLAGRMALPQSLDRDLRDVRGVNVREAEFLPPVKVEPGTRSDVEDLQVSARRQELMHGLPEDQPSQPVYLGVERRSDPGWALQRPTQHELGDDRPVVAALAVALLDRSHTDVRRDEDMVQAQQGW
jgi:hypothetical protein